VWRRQRVNRIFFIGAVADNKDPDGLGRLQIELKGFPTPITTPWLHQVLPHATSEKETGGFVFIPEVGDQVVVLSPTYGSDVCVEDLSSMIVLGCLYNGNIATAYSNDDGDNITKQIQTKSGNLLQFSDKDGEETITIQCKDDKTSIVLEAKTPTITLTAKDGSLTIGKDDKGSIEIKTKGKISIKAEDAVTVKGKEIKIESASANVEIKSAADVKIKGKNIEVKGSGKVIVKGAMVEIN